MIITNINMSQNVSKQNNTIQNVQTIKICLNAIFFRMWPCVGSASKVCQPLDCIIITDSKAWTNRHPASSKLTRCDIVWV